MIRPPNKWDLTERNQEVALEHDVLKMLERVVRVAHAGRYAPK
jgi:hypothetical protein